MHSDNDAEDQSTSLETTNAAHDPSLRRSSHHSPSHRRSNRPGKRARLGYSLLSTLIALVLLALGVGISNLRNGTGEVLTVALATILYGGSLCLAGWLLSLPLVLSVRRFRGWRYWAVLSAGTCIGPVVMLLAALYLSRSDPNFAGFAPEAYHLVYLAAGVSFLTSFLYLNFIRRHRKVPAQH